MKLGPKIETAWVDQQLEECFDEGKSLKSYVEQNGLCDESQGLVAVHCRKPKETLSQTNCPQQICVKIICWIGDYATLTDQTAIKVYCACTKKFNWCKNNQIPKYAEINFLQNLNCDARLEFITDYTKIYSISDEAVPAYLIHYVKFKRNDHTYYFPKSILGVKRPDEIVREIYIQDPDLLKDYFLKYEDIPEDIFEKMLDNTSFFNKCVVSKGLTSQRLLNFLMLKAESKYILAFLNGILNEKFVMQIFLSAEDQKAFLQRSDFGNKTDYIIHFYNAVIGFDTEVLEECDRLDMIEERATNRTFSLTADERKKQEEEEARRKQEEAEEEERRKQQQAEEEEARRLYSEEKTEYLAETTSDENLLQQQLDETQKQRDQYVERVSQIREERKDSFLCKLWHAIIRLLTRKKA